LHTASRKPRYGVAGSARLIILFEESSDLLGLRTDAGVGLNLVGLKFKPKPCKFRYAYGIPQTTLWRGRLCKVNHYELIN
jgi:hypothetical protein